MNKELQQNKMDGYFAVITKSGIEKVKCDDILYFESEGRKIHIHTKGRKISFNGSIEHIREKLDKRFCDCHGSYIVNLTKVVRLYGSNLEIEGGNMLPVSQRRSAKTRHSYKTYLTKHFPCNLEDDIV
ncbi:MAG TPA: LytTR family DNA-binding domain-containing protein [Anaerovoracaceae bacterium]|nr:LytTR family DNA-binding domain-containing protein [Anaerovoracaceae bacterium]